MGLENIVNGLINRIEAKKPKLAPRVKEVYSIYVTGKKVGKAALGNAFFLYPIIGSFPGKKQEQWACEFGKWPLLYSCASIGWGAFSLASKYLSAKGLLSFLHMPNYFESLGTAAINVIAAEGIAETIIRSAYIAIRKKPVGVLAMMEFPYFIITNPRKTKNFLYSILSKIVKPFCRRQEEKKMEITSTLRLNERN